MRKLRYLLAVAALGVVLAGCDKESVPADVAPPLGVSESTGTNSGALTQTGTDSGAGEEHNSALPERTEAEGGAIEATFGWALDNPLIGYDVIYAGEYGELDRETVDLIEVFMDTYSREKAEPGKIVSITCADFDNDDKAEAYIFYGFNDDYCYTGDYCYVDNGRTTVIGEYDVYAADGYIDCGDKKFAFFDEYYVSEAISHVFEIKNGKPVETNISMIGDVFVSEDGEVTITYSAYNGMYDKTMGFMIGHTWLPYYFYYDKDKGEFVENAGRALKYDEVNDCCGFDLMGQITDDENLFYNAFIRTNGILTINICQDEEDLIDFQNVNYDCINKKFVGEHMDGADELDYRDFLQDGIYMTSLSMDTDADSTSGMARETLKITISSNDDIFYMDEFEKGIVASNRDMGRFFLLNDNTKGDITKAGTYEVIVDNGFIVSVK